jgi:hypothetical protein
MYLRVTFAAIAAAAILSINLVPCIAQDEPSDAQRGLEKLEKQLNFEWTNISVQISRQLSGDRSTNRSIQLSGQASIVDDEGILGVTHQAELTEVVDENGTVLLKLDDNKVGRQTERHFSSPPRRQPRLAGNQPFGPGAQPETEKMHFSVDFPLPESTVPKKLQTVKARMYLLVGKTMPVDIPLEKSDEWTELAPGLSVHLTKADVRGSAVEYQLQGKGDKANQSFSGWIGEHNPLPTAFVAKMALVDTGGEEHQIGGMFSSNIGGSASFGGGRTLTTMRLYVATDVNEVAVPFEAKDLRVPGFGDN